MTDKRTDILKETQHTENLFTENLPLEDEQLLASFFADNAIEALPDDGFSERVMAALPKENAYHLNRWWTLICVLLGVIMMVTLKGWQHLPQWDLSSVTLFLHYLPIITTTYLQAIFNSTTLLHCLLLFVGAIVTIGGVWGYNEMVESMPRRGSTML